MRTSSLSSPPSKEGGDQTEIAALNMLKSRLNHDVELENRSVLEPVLPPWFLRGELEGGLCAEAYSYIVRH